MNAHHAHALALLAVLGAFTLPAGAQSSDIDAVKKHSWGENIGWMNWRDANGGEQGVRVHATFLSGFIWCENAGWVNAGDGSPADGFHYANVDASEYGVNVDPATGDLFGLAWGESVGWINFDTRAALGPFGQQARFDAGAGRFRGYAWSQNEGWINLDHHEHFVALACAVDCNGDGTINTIDLVCFLNLFVASDPAADCNGDTVVNTIDFICFLDAFLAGCG